MKYLFLLIYGISSISSSFAQRIEEIANRAAVSFRGISVVNDDVIWVSGSSGTVGRSIDGGKTWQWMIVPDFEERDFRDIEAFDSHTAIIMAVDEPAIILKTQNDGLTWKVVYRNDSRGMFLDAMEFWNQQSGIVIGDPVKGRFFVARTFDEGNNWKALTHEKLPLAEKREACFAASGTNVRALDRDEACFVSGGSKSRLFWKGTPIELPIISGTESQGANSVAVWFKHTRYPKIAVVGGDFNKPEVRTKNCAISRDGGASWITPSNPPFGYRSCVEYISENRLITCGLNGVDISLDEGINWNAVSQEGFHVVRKAKKGKSVFLAGSEKIGKLIWE